MTAWVRPFTTCSILPFDGGKETLEPFSIAAFTAPRDIFLGAREKQDVLAVPTLNEDEFFVELNQGKSLDPKDTLLLFSKGFNHFIAPWSFKKETGSMSSP